MTNINCWLWHFVASWLENDWKTWLVQGLSNSVVFSFLFPPPQSIGTWKPWQAVVNQRKCSTWLTPTQISTGLKLTQITKCMETLKLSEYKKVGFLSLARRRDANIDTNIIQIKRSSFVRIFEDHFAIQSQKWLNHLNVYLLASFLTFSFCLSIVREKVSL